MDGIIDTVSAHHPLNPLVDLLRSQGKLILLGAPDVERPAELSIFPLIVGKFVFTFKFVPLSLLNITSNSFKTTLSKTSNSAPNDM